MTLDLREKGRAKDGTPIVLDRRLYMQFLAFSGASDVASLSESLSSSGIEGVLYIDLNDPRGVGLLIMSENEDFFVSQLREFLNTSFFKGLILKEDYVMFGRTYSFGYEDDLERTLITGPKSKVLDPKWKWAIWYPLRRKKNFETLPEEEKRAILGEHGKVGFQFGKAGYATDIRLACFGLDKNDNDFVIGVLGEKLHPISAVVERMRKTKQTSLYLESLGPFFVGKVIYQSKINE